MSARNSHSALAGLAVESSHRGRPLVRPPGPRETQTEPSSVPMASQLRPTVTYKESGQRWMERQEARSLREALQDMDMRAEARLHAAAQAEAAELVWRHQNQSLPYVEAKAPHKYKEHLRKGSHARFQAAEDQAVMSSISKQNVNFDQTSGPSDPLQWNSRSSNLKDGRSSSGSRSSTNPSEVSEGRPTGKVHGLWDSPQKKAYMNLTFPIPLVHSRKSSGGRKISWGKGRKTSTGGNQGVFKNPEDQIYEDPETVTESLPNAEGCGNGGFRAQKGHITHPINKDIVNIPRRASKAVLATGRKVSLQESHGNFPSQKHNPGYVVNDLPAATSGSEKEESLECSEDTPRMKNGLEIRSEEIRSATSMKLRDRSPKLPSPTAVSDSPDRPIVSFDLNWQPKVKNPDEQDMRDHRIFNAGQFNGSTRSKSPSPVVREPSEKLDTSNQASVDRASNQRGSSFENGPIPVLTISGAPSVETNECSATNIPSIKVLDCPTISIDSPAASCDNNISRQQDSKSSSRPLPSPNIKTGSRRLPHPMPTTRAVPPFPDRTSSLQRYGASCTQCGLAIAGRIVSAAGERFHPECFACYNCGEGLECVAFYPEPETKRAERLDRIERRARGLIVEERSGQGELEDGDPSLRFYCHLDYHELFSPRCKSCKTPIEGEVVMACGAEWHVGHFFCAQCGDVSLILLSSWLPQLTYSQPFDPSTPFVERDGYAWCVNCHTNRFSTKCKKCRKPVTDMVLKALGAEWHPQCFRCTASYIIYPLSCVRQTDEVLGMWRRF